MHLVDLSCLVLRKDNLELDIILIYFAQLTLTCRHKFIPKFTLKYQLVKNILFRSKITIQCRLFWLSFYVKSANTGLGSSVGRVSIPRSGGTGFDPGPRHTKVVNNGTSCSPLGTRIFGVGLALVAPVSV